MGNDDLTRRRDEQTPDAPPHETVAPTTQGRPLPEPAADVAPTEPREPVVAIGPEPAGNVAGGHEPEVEAPAGGVGSPGASSTEPEPEDESDGLDVPVEFDPAVPGSPAPIADAPKFPPFPHPQVPHVVIAVVLVAIAAAAILAGTYSAELWGGRTLPDVAGMSADEAQATLEQSGFTVARKESPTDDGVGSVLGTDPAGGTRTDPSREVELLVGVPRLVPDVVGKSLDDARSAFSERGIDNLRLEYVSSDEPEGTVLSVSPERGQAVSAQTEVIVRVAQPFTVPDVVGLSQDDAAKAIGEAGLQSKVTWQESDKEALTVLETSPKAGERTTSGATVNLMVAAPGPRDETYLPDYLVTRPQGIADYLGWKGWKFGYAQDRDGVAEEGWSKAGVGELTFTSEPETGHHGMFLGNLLTQSVLARGAKVAGVRFVAEAPDATVDTATLNSWMQRCGLAGLRETLTSDELWERYALSGRVPAPGSEKAIGGYGQTSGCDWVVVVIGGSEVHVMAVPTGGWSKADTSPYGGLLLAYLMVIDLYTG